MSIQGISPSGNAVTPGATSPPATGKPQPSLQDQFLQLLVAQLKSQDPLQPQDGTAFVSQLAELSSLQQTTQTNQTLSTIAANESSAQSSSYATLVGRTVAAKTSSITLDGNSVPSLGGHLDTSSAKTEMVISDATGKVVRTVELGAHAAGDFDVPWTGTDDSGKPLPPGAYSVAVKATDPKGGVVSGFAEVKGIIKALDFSSGSPMFRIGATTVAPTDVVSVQ